MTPQVSVCIPVFNGAPYIAEAVRSVLDQTFGDIEVIVVDNRSTDGSAEVVKSIEDPRLRLVESDDHVDAVTNWNRALSGSQGTFVKLVCADDALAPTCLERQVEALVRHPRAVLAASRRDIVDEDGRVLIRARGLAGMEGYVDGREAIARCVRTGANPLGEPASVLMRGETLRAVGPWRGQFRYMLDLDMWFRLLDHGGLVAIPESLAIFRVHRASWSAAAKSDQARDTRALHSNWAGTPGSRVRRADVLQGAVRAELMRIGRGLVYTPPVRWLQQFGAR